MNKWQRFGLTAGAVAMLGFSTQLPAHAATDLLRGRIDAATNYASHRGARVGIAFLDRFDGSFYTNSRAHTAIPTASVVKVFLADNLLMRESRGELRLSGSDRGALSIMLRSSDDGAAQRFWDRFGGIAIVGEVLGRYHLGESRPAGAWFNTRVSAADMASYYRQLIEGRGGLPAPARDFILSQLRAFTTNGTDGYNQRFGLPRGLTRESVQAVKQGWMQSGPDWIHNSTDVVGAENRYVVVIFAQESSRFGDAHARATIDQIARIMFPSGAVPTEPGPSGSAAGLPAPLQQLADSINTLVNPRH